MTWRSAPNDIEFSGERKRVRCNEWLDTALRPPSSEKTERVCEADGERSSREACLTKGVLGAMDQAEKIRNEDEPPQYIDERDGGEDGAKKWKGH